MRKAIELVIAICLVVEAALPGWASCETILSTEWVLEPKVETKIESKLIPLPAETLEATATIRTTVLRKGRTLYEEQKQTKGFATILQKTYRKWVLLQDTIARRTKTFQRTENQERTITIRTPRWKQLAHCRSTSLQIRYQPRIETVWEEEWVPRVNQEKATIDGGYANKIKAGVPCALPVLLTRSEAYAYTYPVTRTREVTTYTETTVCDVEPGKIVGYKNQPEFIWSVKEKGYQLVFPLVPPVLWMARVPVYTAAKLLYRVERVPHTATESYTVMESKTVQREVSVPATMTKVLSFSRHDRIVRKDEPTRYRLFGEIATKAKELVARAVILYQPEAYEVVEQYDKVLAVREGNELEVSVSPWQTVSISEELIRSKEILYEGKPYEGRISYETEESRFASLGMASASGWSGACAVTTNSQCGDSLRRISYVGCDKALDNVVLSQRQRKAKPEKPKQGKDERQGRPGSCGASAQSLDHDQGATCPLEILYRWDDLLGFLFAGTR